MKEECIIRAMKKADYEAVFALWQQIKGFGIRSIDDSAANIHAFLERNKDLSVVCELGAKFKECGKLVGTILCGHDGRTGSFYHVCVHKDYQKQGIAHKMSAFCIDALKREKINNITLIAFKSNAVGNAFWKNYGFVLREDANYYDLSLNDFNATKFNE